MIKFTATLQDDTKLLGIGLSHKNLERLKDGKPIKFVGEDVGLPGQEVLIFAGKTEDSMVRGLNEFIMADTIIADIRR